MGGYIYGIIVAAAVVGMAEALLPSGKKTRQYVRLMAALCLLCLALRPVSTFLSVLPERLLDGLSDITGEETAQSSYQSILEGEIRETVRAELEKAIRKDLAERFSVEHCDVGIALASHEGALSVERIVITLTGTDIFKNPHTIEEYFSELLDCECLAVIG